MPCNCDGRLDAIMKYLEEMRAEIGVVKTKCIRIEKEILGITEESEMIPEALMETTTVRHIVEKLAYDLGVLNEESSRRASADGKIQKELEASEELHSKFLGATNQKMKDLKLKYGVLTLKTFQAQFSDFLEEFRSQTESALSKRAFAPRVIYDIVEEVTRTTDLVQLYDRHFLDRNKETESFIRENYARVVQIYAKEALEGKDDTSESGLRVIKEFLAEFKLCEETFASFQEELLNAFRETNEQIEANRGLLERLTQEYRDSLRNISDLWRRAMPVPRFLELKLKSKIIVTNPQLVPIFIEKLKQNMKDISSASDKK